jgi:S1-C subfamily serine protease
MMEAEARFRAATDAYAGLSVKPLLSFGLGTVTISPADTKLFGAHGKGLLVTSVQEGSAAAQVKVRAGDIIESINGQLLSDANWNFHFSTDFDSDLSLGILRDGEKLTLKLSRQNAPK